MKKEICNYDCFNCIYDDCINDSLSYNDYKQSKALDKESKQVTGKVAETYYERNKERIRMQRKQYYKKNKEKVLQYHKEYMQKVKKENPFYYKEYYQKNKEARKRAQREYYKRNKDRITQKRKLAQKEVEANE